MRSYRFISWHMRDGTAPKKLDNVWLAWMDAYGSDVSDDLYTYCIMALFLLMFLPFLIPSRSLLFPLLPWLFVFGAFWLPLSVFLLRLFPFDLPLCCVSPPLFFSLARISLTWLTSVHVIPNVYYFFYCQGWFYIVAQLAGYVANLDCLGFPCICL